MHFDRSACWFALTLLILTCGSQLASTLIVFVELEFQVSPSQLRFRSITCEFCVNSQQQIKQIRNVRKTARFIFITLSDFFYLSVNLLDYVRAFIRNKGFPFFSDSLYRWTYIFRCIRLFKRCNAMPRRPSFNVAWLIACNGSVSQLLPRPRHIQCLITANTINEPASCCWFFKSLDRSFKTL